MGWGEEEKKIREEKKGKGSRVEEGKREGEEEKKIREEKEGKGK